MASSDSAMVDAQPSSQAAADAVVASAERRSLKRKLSPSPVAAEEMPTRYQKLAEATAQAADSSAMAQHQGDDSGVAGGATAAAAAVASPEAESPLLAVCSAVTAETSPPLGVFAKEAATFTAGKQYFKHVRELMADDDEGIRGRSERDRSAAELAASRAASAVNAALAGHTLRERTRVISYAEDQPEQYLKYANKPSGWQDSATAAAVEQLLSTSPFTGSPNTAVKPRLRSRSPAPAAAQPQAASASASSSLPARLPTKPVLEISETGRAAFRANHWVLLRSSRNKAIVQLTAEALAAHNDCNSRAVTISGGTQQYMIKSLPRFKSVLKQWRKLIESLAVQLGMPVADVITPSVLCAVFPYGEQDLHWDRIREKLSQLRLTVILYLTAHRSAALPQFPYCRAFSTSNDAAVMKQHVDKLDRRLYESYDVAPGDILIFDQSVPHYGTANLQRDSERVLLFGAATPDPSDARTNEQVFRFGYIGAACGEDSAEYADALVDAQQYSDVFAHLSSEQRKQAELCLKKHNRKLGAPRSLAVTREKEAAKP